MMVGLQVDMAQAYAQTTSFWSAVLAGLLGSAFAFLMFNYASQHVATRHTAMSLNLIPVVAIAVGALLGRGLPTSIQLAGAAVVLVSLLALDSVATTAPVPPH
jgi:drug/metabolite transporter (DMT)-like permease